MIFIELESCLLDHEITEFPSRGKVFNLEWTLTTKILGQENLPCSGNASLGVTQDLKESRDSMGEVRRLSYLSPDVGSCHALLRARKLEIKMSDVWCEWGTLRPDRVRYAVFSRVSETFSPGRGGITTDGRGQKTAK